MNGNAGPSEVLAMLAAGLIDWWEDPDGFVLWYDPSGRYRFGPAEVDDWSVHDVVDPEAPDFAGQLRRIKAAK